MRIPQINLRERLDQARFRFDAQLAAVLVGRPDLSLSQIEKEFGVSKKVTRRVIRQFNVGARKRGPKPKAMVPAS
jgi:transposase